MTTTEPGQGPGTARLQAGWRRRPHHANHEEDRTLDRFDTHARWGLSGLQRAGIGCAGMALGAVLMVSLTALFDDASTMRWLRPTPANVAALKRCDGVVGTAARHACVESVVEAVQARAGATRLAAADAAPPAVD